MAFEEEIHQHQDDEVTQLQKQKENDQFQRELDEIIVRLENEQFQKELDEIIKNLEQGSQEHPSTEEELSSHESVSEEESEQQDILEKLSTSNSEDQLISYDKETAEEEQTQNQDLTGIEYSLQEEQDSVGNQKIDLNLLQVEEENPITEHLDHMSQQSPSAEDETTLYDSKIDIEPISLEQSAQSSDNQSIFHHEENTEEQATQKFIETDKSVLKPTTQTPEEFTHWEFGTIVENQKSKQFHLIKDRMNHADGELTKLEGVQHKQSSKSVKRQEQSHSQASNFSEQLTIETQVKPESTTQSIEEKNKRNISQHTLEVNERINLLISEALEAGFNSLKTGKMSNIDSFTNHWNQIVKLGKPPTKEMIMLYNEIKEKHGVSLYVINYKTAPGYKIRNFGNLPSIIDEWFTRKYTTYFNEWLIYRGHLEGKSAFIKVWVRGLKNREKELYLIPNYEATKWNTNGVPMELWKPKRSFILRSGLFTEVKFPPRYKYDPSRRNTVLIRHPVKERIINCLKNVVDNNGKPIYKYPKEVSRQSWFNSAYQLKFDESLIDEYLEGIYWQRIKTGRTRAERSSLKLSIINYYERLGERITSLSDLIIESELNETFEIYLVDESKALWDIISLLNDVIPLKTVTTFDEWIDKLKTEFGSEIARIIQNAKLQNLNKVPITFKLTDADKYQGGETLTRDPIRFWVEKYTDGISGFAKALIGDNRVRKALKEFSEASDGSKQLDLPLNVKIETNWAHNPTRVNIVTMPDIVVKEKTGRKFHASEIVQNKVLREIGDNCGQISPRDYLLEYLRTMGEYDPNNCSIKNIQLEFIPSGNTLGGRTDIAEDTNVVIISYWGNDVPQIGRVPEIIQSLRMIRYLNKIENREIINRKVVDKLKQGIGALGFQRKMDENTSRVIQELTELTSADGEVTFFRDSFLELLRKYGMALVSNNYSLESEKKGDECENH